MERRIRAYGWRCVKATFIRGLWPNTGLFLAAECINVRMSASPRHALLGPFSIITLTPAHWQQKNDDYCGVSMNLCTWQTRPASFALRPTCSPWEEFREHVGQKTANFTAARNDLFAVEIFSTLAKNKKPGTLRRKSHKKNVKDEQKEHGRKEK